MIPVKMLHDHNHALPPGMLSAVSNQGHDAGMDLPLKAIREQVASSMELIIQLERLKDGTRKVTKVSEVQRMESDTIVMQDLFAFHQTSFNNGFVQGVHKPTGLRPHFMDKFVANGIQVPDEVFDKHNSPI